MPVQRRPAVSGLYSYDSAGRPSPIASKCNACGAMAFPARDTCEECLSADLQMLPLGSEGTLYAFTVVHEPFGVGSLPPPYGVGVIEFADGFQIRGLLDPGVKEWSVGHPVVTTEIVLDHDGDTELLTYALTPGGATHA